MYGLISKIRVAPGQRDKLATLLIASSSGMQGCLSYIIAADVSNPDALWVTEVWDSPSSHRASLSSPAVQQAIAVAKPIIAGFAERFETEPLGGTGIIAR
jgi:quinol monooxygenase YgiN